MVSEAWDSDLHFVGSHGKMLAQQLGQIKPVFT
jgi:hypothetical protein